MDVGFWEKSIASAKLISTYKLEIIDRSVNGHVLAQASVVDLKIFCEEIISSTKKYAKLAFEIKSLIDKMTSSKKTEQIIRKMCWDESDNYSVLIEKNLKEHLK